MADERKGARRFLPDLRDVFVFVGLGLAAFGAWQLNQPAGYIVAGAGLFYLGRWGE